MANPVMVASGTFGYAEEFESFVDLNQIGGIITKTVTPDHRPGNPPPRIAETAAGMLNSIGLPNVGVNGFIRQKMPFLKKLDTCIFVNVAGKTIEEFVHVVEKLDDIKDISGYELNFSCPNVKEGGLAFSSDPKMAERATKLVRNATAKPLIAKLTPNVTSIGQIGLAVENGGADAVSAVNTFVGMAINIHTRRPRLATITGGLSGPAIKPLALAKVYELVKNITIPVIGIGGIMDFKDALEFFIAGATAIQVGTANFINPRATMDILNEMQRYGESHSIKNINEIIGTLE